ncbi:class I SAM-dependent methyltransferase [Pontibacter litorisediminis]|uniref:class I SAM-dependent methyltransferase n=1 Tax=Pontibacter litorisediminis TaxID=1846260 RepID=UPI0023EB802B|nr:class I SAM-dependent methyltransferase [Pontibacter litorisediminis]
MSLNQGRPNTTFVSINLRSMTMKDFWNDRYNQEQMVYGAEPNEFFREQLQFLRPGKLLLPAEGEGRNAVYAALKGWQVTAFDFSEAGRKKAMALAKQRGVPLNYQVTDAAQFSCEPESQVAVALIYAHFPPALRQQLHQKVINWLTPGGTVILEAFHPYQLSYSSGGPKDERMLYTAEVLQDDFKLLDIKLLQELDIHLHEGPYHSGAGYITRMVAQKRTDNQENRNSKTKM